MAGTLTLQVAPIVPPAPLSPTRVIPAIRAGRMKPVVFALKFGRSTMVGADLRFPPTS